jgi:hypothetical protein
MGYCYPRGLEKTLCKWIYMSRWSRKGSNRTSIRDTVPEDQYIPLTISRSIFLRMRHVADNSNREKQNTFNDQ